MTEGVLGAARDNGGDSGRPVSRWGVVREVWDELPVLLLANLALAVSLVPALVFWGSGSIWLSLTTTSVACCVFWTWVSRRFDPEVEVRDRSRRSSWMTLGRSAGVGLSLGVLVTSAVLAVRWAASGSAAAVVIAVITCCESLAAGAWTLSGLRLASRGASVRDSFRAGYVALTRNPGRAALVTYECAMVVLLVVMFGFWVLVVAPGPVAVIAVRQLAGKEETSE